MQCDPSSRRAVAAAAATRLPRRAAPSLSLAVGRAGRLPGRLRVRFVLGFELQVTVTVMAVIAAKPG